MGPLMVFNKLSVSLFPLNKKTSPTHKSNITQIFLQRNTYWACISTVTILKKVLKAEFEYFFLSEKCV